jgi:hypothetical protein
MAGPGGRRPSDRLRCPRPRQHALHGHCCTSVRTARSRHRLRPVLLRSPRVLCPDPRPVARRGRRPVVWLPLPARRHRDKHPAKVRDHLDADDLRVAHLPDAGPAGSTLEPLAVAGQPDLATGACIRPSRRAAAPALHQDAHTADRDSFRPPGHVHRDGPASARRVRVAVLPRQHVRPSAGTTARPALGLRAPRIRWTTLASWSTVASRSTAAAWSTTGTAYASRAAGRTPTQATGG